MGIVNSTNGFIDSLVFGFNYSAIVMGEDIDFVDGRKTIDIVDYY